LTTLARKAGYQFFDDQQRRDWVHRGIFPKAHIDQSRSGGRFSGGLWSRGDALRLLDLCILHEQNRTARALQLGSWLHGYTLANDETIIPFLTQQVDRVETRLYGQTLPTEFDLLPEKQMEAMARQIEHVLEDCSIADNLCYGLDSTAYISEAEYNESHEYHPEVDAGPNNRQLREFMFARQVAGVREIDALSDQMLFQRWLQDRWKDHHFPRAPLSEFLEWYDQQFPANVALSAEQLAYLQQQLLEGYLMHDFVSLLPQFRRSLSNASDAELQFARAVVFQIMSNLLTTYRFFPDPALTALTRFGEQLHWHPRHVFAAPAFFPLMAYMVAASIYEARHARSIRFRHSMIPVALDQLARLARESTSRTDAFLAVLFSVIPASTQRTR
jgi:hypothetical protein